MLKENGKEKGPIVRSWHMHAEGTVTEYKYLWLFKKFNLQCGDFLIDYVKSLNEKRNKAFSIGSSSSTNDSNFKKMCIQRDLHNLMLLGQEICFRL